MSGTRRLGENHTLRFDLTTGRLMIVTAPTYLSMLKARVIEGYLQTLPSLNKHRMLAKGGQLWRALERTGAASFTHGYS